MRRLLLIAAVVISGSCLSGPSAIAPTPNRSGSEATTPQASREPSALAQYPEELPVLVALARAGIHVDLIGGSKFEGLLGAPRRARVFIGSIGGERVGADVLFLDAPAGDIRVCSSSGSAPGFTKVTITVNGAPGSSGEGSQSMYFGAGDRFFVMTSDPRVREALFRDLGLEAPRC